MQVLLSLPKAISKADNHCVADVSFQALIERFCSGIYLFPDAAHTTESLGGEASQSLQITWDDPTGRSVLFHCSGALSPQTVLHGENLLKTK